MAMTTTRGGFWRRWWFPIAVLGIAGAVIAGIVLAQNGGGSQQQVAGSRDTPTDVVQPEQPDFSAAERRDPDDLLAAGPVDAPVVLVVFSDYQCPYCGKWSAATLPAMLELAEQGDLRIEWRDVNVFGDASMRAARASYAAALQGSFWEYHDALFPGGEKRPASDLDDDRLIALAGELGLDPQRFALDYASAETAAAIAENAQLGLDVGAYSTPAFLMGGVPIVGAQPTELFVQAFESALAAAG